MVQDGVALIRFWTSQGRQGLVYKKKGEGLAIIVLSLLYKILHFVFREGRRHDSGTLADSGVYELTRNSFDPAKHLLCLYGDPTYPLRVHLQAPFRNVVLTQQMEDFNSSTSSVRSSVEWLFDDISNDFKYPYLKKNLKIGLSSVGKMYIVSAFLKNPFTCLYRNTTSMLFDLDPPNCGNFS